MEKIYIFGAGLNGKKNIDYFGKDNVIAFVDNSSALIGEKLCEKDIISVETLINQYRDEKIVVSSVYFYEDIKNQLIELGIKKIYKSPFISTDMLNKQRTVEIIQMLKCTKIFYQKEDIHVIPIIEAVKEYEPNLEALEFDDLQDIRIDNANDCLVLKCSYNIKIDKDYQIIDLLKLHENQYDYLKKYKNLCKGQKCFIIGNGPSLTVADLNEISKKQIKSFGCNGIYKIFDKTEWRPTYYFYGDANTFAINRYITDESVYFISDQIDLLDDDKDKVNSFHHDFGLEEDGTPFFSEKVDEKVYGGRSVTYVMMQFAIYMGFTEIYLLGMDLSWGENGKTHFCDNYVDEKMDKLVREAKVHKDALISAYRQAKKYAEKNNAKIYNATRGGNLEVFERVDFDALFNDEDKK